MLFPPVVHPARRLSEFGFAQWRAIPDQPPRGRGEKGPAIRDSESTIRRPAYRPAAPLATAKGHNAWRTGLKSGTTAAGSLRPPRCQH